jgi:hypothetical protein
MDRSNEEGGELTREEQHMETDGPAPGKNLVGGKWVYTKKKRSDGTVERYKARWAAKGFTQKQDIDYNETFAPVVKYKSLRIIMAPAAINDYEIKHMDVETAFLNATIQQGGALYGATAWIRSRWWSSGMQAHQDTIRYQASAK